MTMAKDVNMHLLLQSLDVYKAVSSAGVPARSSPVLHTCVKSNAHTLAPQNVCKDTEEL